jgi:hypothetical protein
MVKERNFIALAIIAALAACGGGGGGSSTPAGGSLVGGSPAATPTPGALPTSGTLPAGYLVTSVAITLPAGKYSASTRRTQTVGTGTTSITFTLLQLNGVSATSTPQNFGLTASSTGCAKNASQALVCTLGVDAPIGQDVFLAQTYDANGNLTGSGAVALSVALKSTNAAAITLSAQVASVFVVPGSTYLGSFQSQNLGMKTRLSAQGSRRSPAGGVPPFLNSMPVFVIASDSANNTILNPSNYSSPIYVQVGFDLWSSYTADVTLNVTYGVSDAAPCTAGATASASGWYASLMLCSPSDLVTASVATNPGDFPSDLGYIYGWVSAASLVPTPAPSQAPQPFQTPASNTFAEFYVNVTPPPTPVPTPTGPSGPITVIGQ